MLMLEGCKAHCSANRVSTLGVGAYWPVNTGVLYEVRGSTGEYYGTWDVMPCCLVEAYWYFEGTCYLHLHALL